MIELVYITDRETGIKYYVKSMTSINETMSTTITEYATTEGTNISDHAYVEPNNVTLSLITSELNRQAQNIYYEGTANNIVKVDLSSAKELFTRWYRNQTRLLLQTRLHQFNNMVITNINLTEDSSNRGQYNPTITLRECRIATLYTEILGPFENVTGKPTYSQEKDMGTSNGASWEGTLGGIAAGATIGGIIFGPWGAVVGGAIGAFGNWVGWW